ncbi:MAG: hypothetical protein GY804_04525 [Alphaproteobacteria bacterium]|nr:hypothetical protein [Alphaproteobacteria bacterium]
MNKAKSWIAEFLWALRSLNQNPYLRHRLDKIWKLRFLMYTALGYLILTIAHVSVNWGTFTSDFHSSLSLDIALQRMFPGYNVAISIDIKSLYLFLLVLCSH